MEDLPHLLAEAHPVKVHGRYALGAPGRFAGRVPFPSKTRCSVRWLLGRSLEAMKFLRVGAAIACLSLGVLVPSVAYAQPLPKVWVGGPNPAPCYNTVEVHGKYVNHKIACYEVRPSTIALSEDGNGFLSDLHWTTWSVTNAVGTGTKYQRCYFPLGNQGPRCVGKLGGGYNVPVWCSWPSLCRRWMAVVLGPY